MLRVADDKLLSISEFAKLPDELSFFMIKKIFLSHWRPRKMVITIIAMNNYIKLVYLRITRFRSFSRRSQGLFE